MTDPMELVERLDQRAVAARSENTATALGDAIHFEQAAARIRDLVEWRDEAISAITDTCAKATGMENATDDSVTRETVALVASRCRAFQQLTGTPPSKADRGGA